MYLIVTSFKLHESAKTLVTILGANLNLTHTKVYYIFLKKSTLFVLLGHRAHDGRIREKSGTDNSREVAPGKRIGSR